MLLRLGQEDDAEVRIGGCCSGKDRKMLLRLGSEDAAEVRTGGCC